MYGGYIKNNTEVLGRHIKNKVSKTYNNIKIGTSKFWNTTKWKSEKKIMQFKKSAKKHYNSVKTSVHNFLDNYAASTSEKYQYSIYNRPKGSDGINSLANYVDKQADRALGEYASSSSNELNRFLQLTGFKIVNGVADYLDSIGMDDEVANFLEKFNKRK